MTQSDNTPPGAGNEYCFDLSFFPKVAVGSPFANNNATVATAVRGDQAAALSNCSAPYRDAVVVTRAAETGAGAEVTFDVFFE